MAGKHRVFLHIYVIMVYKYTHSLGMPTALFRKTPKPSTPPEAGTENAPEVARGWLGNRFSEISQRKMPVSSAGERRPHIEWGTGILCYLFFKTKGNYHYSVFSANHGQWS